MNRAEYVVPFQATNRERFRALMELHGLSNEAAAGILGKKTNTILAYRSNNGVDISDQLLELFEIKMQSR